MESEESKERRRLPKREVRVFVERRRKKLRGVSFFWGRGHEIKGGELCFSRERKERSYVFLEMGERKERRCDTPKPGDSYTQIPYCDTLKSEGSLDNSSTRGIFVVVFLYIFLTQILIIFYKNSMHNSFTLLHTKIY